MSLQYTVAGSVALVTGANRGIGLAYVRELLALGAKRVYAAARDPQTLEGLAAEDARVVPIQLDITDDASVEAAATRLGDVTLLINNAGIARGTRLIGAPNLSGAHDEMEVNYFGLLRMARAFAPILGANGGGAMVNVLSILGRVTSPLSGSYSASKFAAFALTQGVRAELRQQGTLVVGVMPGYVDTDMAAGFTAPKITPADVAKASFAALETGVEDVYPGAVASQVAELLLLNPKAVEADFARSIAQ